MNKTQAQHQRREWRCFHRLVLRRLWQWKNRAVTNLYHLTHGIKTTTRDFEHLRECRHCREGFEKWKVENVKD